MKNFVFKYESILKMRGDKVDDIMASLKALNGQMELIEGRLDDVAGRKKIFMAGIGEKLKSGCPASELQALRSSYDYFSSEEGKVRSEMEKLAIQIEEERGRLVEASREKRIMEKVKEKGEVVHREENARIENKIVEELVNYRNFRKDCNRG